MIRPELDFYAPPVNFNAVNVERRNKQRTNIFAWRATSAADNNTQNSSSSYYTGNNLHKARGTYTLPPSHTSLARNNATSIERFMPGSTRAAAKERQYELEVNGHWPRGAVMMPDRRRQWKMSGFDFTQTQKTFQSSSFFHKSQIQERAGSTKIDKTLPKHGKYKNLNRQHKNKTHGSSSNKDQFMMNNTYFHDTITFYKPSSSSSLTDTHMDAESQENETSHSLPLLSRMRQEYSSSENKTNKLNKFNASSTSTLLALTCNSAELQAMCLNGTITNNNCTTAKGDVKNDEAGKNSKTNENNCKSTNAERKEEELNAKQKLYNDRQWVRQLGPVLETKYECNQVADEFCKTLNHPSADSTEMFDKNEIGIENSKLEKTAAGETKDVHKAAPISLPTAELAYTLRPKYAHEHSHTDKTNLPKQEKEQQEESRQNAYFANTYDGNVKDTNQFMLSGRNWNRTMYNNFNDNTITVDNSNVNRNYSTRETKCNKPELAQGHLRMNKNNVSNNNNSTMYLRPLHLLPTEAKLMRLYAVNVPTAMQSSDLSMVRRQEPPRLGVKISLESEFSTA